MPIATSNKPADSNPLAALFPAAAPGTNNFSLTPEGADGEAEFDELFPDLAPAPASVDLVPAAAATAAAALAAYSVTTAEPASWSALGASSPEPLGVGLASADDSALPEPGAETSASDICDQMPVPSRSTFRSPRVNGRIATSPADGAGEVPSPAPAATPAVRPEDLPLVAMPNAPAPRESAAPDKEEDKRLFPGIERKAPTASGESTRPSKFGRLVGRRAQGELEPAAAESSRPAPAPGASALESAFNSGLPVALETSPETAATESGDDSFRGESCTRPLGFFTQSTLLSSTVSPNTSAAPWGATPERANAAAVAATPEGSDSLFAVPDPAALREFVPTNPAAESARSAALPARALEAESAGVAASTAGLGLNRNSGSEKSFVGVEAERLEPRRKTVGIDAAKPTSTMSEAFVPPSLQHPAYEYAAAAGGSADRAAQVVAPLAMDALPPEAVSTAHVAVEAVLQAVEHVSAQDQKSVDLQFSVAGVELSVRVELHDNQVRATFRTDSTELRNSLSQEWQAMVSADRDQAQRIAPAVFTASDSGASGSSARDASSGQRDPSGQRSFEPGSTVPTGRARQGESGRPAHPSVSSGPAAPAPTSRHLYTLA